jgi:hypothetical protein
VPFTAAHPLAVVPLIGRLSRRLRLDPTCLVIGSMSPDFEYFARVRLVSRIGHTLPGLVLWCLPVTLLCAWLFHRVVKAPALKVAPRWFAGRLAVFAERPWPASFGGAALASLVASALIGAITHDLWDGVTHRDMWGPQHFAVLREHFVVPGIGPRELCRILQHASTIVGLVALAILGLRALRRVQPIEVVTGGRLVWVACCLVITAAAYVRIARRHETDMGSLVVAACCGLLGGALLAGLITSSRRLLRRQR